MALSAFNKLLQTLRSDPAQAQPPVRFIPAPYMFVHAEPLPEGMMPAEVAGFAEVTIEGLAPMPLDQLAWGYLTQEGALHIFLFAAARDRLESAEISPDESFYHVLPSFYAATPSDQKNAHWVFLWEAGHVSAIRYEANQSIPARVEVELVTEDTPAGAFAARERLVKRLGPTARDAQPGLLARPAAERAGSERLKFFFDFFESAEAAPKRVEGQPPAGLGAVWSADLRDMLFRAEEQKRRRGMKIGSRFLQTAGGLAVLLFVLQMVWVGGNVYYKRQLTQTTQQAPLVTEVQNNMSLLTTIRDFTRKQTRPFEMIQMLNAHRPPGVIFATTKISNFTQLQISGRAPDSGTITRFRDVLNGAGLGDVKVGNISAGGRDTRFDLMVTLRDVPERETNRPVALPPKPKEEPPPPVIVPDDNDQPNLGIAGFQPGQRGNPNNPNNPNFNGGGGGGGDGPEGEQPVFNRGGGRRGNPPPQQEEEEEGGGEEAPVQQQSPNAPLVITGG